MYNAAPRDFAFFLSITRFVVETRADARKARATSRSGHPAAVTLPQWSHDFVLFPRLRDDDGRNKEQRSLSRPAASTPQQKQGAEMKKNGARGRKQALFFFFTRPVTSELTA